ncbi:uL22 family ribosomal protein [Patescibacteria group bacterium]|jgi:ribosomal protein L22|nr:uL22 family ribosomal protein [Patescibacteria group bacterium]
MTQAKVLIRYIRVSPKKMALLASALQKKTLEQARFIVNNCNKGYKEYFLHALSNAEAIIKEKSPNAKSIVVANVAVNQGARLRRQRAGARGYSNAYKHQMSHLSLTLSEATQPSETSDKKEKNGSQN